MTTEITETTETSLQPVKLDRAALRTPDGMPTPAGWHYLSQHLGALMDSKTREGRGGMKFDYVTARQVQDRLDECVGPGNWSTRYKVLYHDPRRNIVVMECQLTIFGVTKADSGTNNNPDIPEYLPCNQEVHGSFLDKESGSIGVRIPIGKPSHSRPRIPTHSNVRR